MADTEKKPAKGDKAAKGGGKPEKGEKAAKPPGKGDKAKAAQAQKGDKGDKGAPAQKAAPGDKKPRKSEERVVARLRTYFDETIRKRLSEQFNYNRMQVPVIEKVVINMGIGEGVADRRKVESAAADLALIAGQKAVITSARK